MIVIILLALISWMILIPRKVLLFVRARSYCIRIIIRIVLLFGALKIDRRVMIYFRKGKGITIKTGKKQERPLKKGKSRPKGVLGIIRKSDFKSLDIRGKLGISGYPYETVLLTGVLRTLAGILVSLADPVKASAGIDPDFRFSAFDVKIDGILKVIPGKLIIEMIKIKKENKK